MKNLIGIEDFSKSEIDELIEVGKDIIDNKDFYDAALWKINKYRKGVLFYEKSIARTPYRARDTYSDSCCL